MEHVEVVVKLPEEAFELLKTTGVDWLGAEHILDAVAKGTVLPKGHGDIVDLNAMINDYWDGNFMEIHTYDLPNIPVIIKAESEDT